MRSKAIVLLVLSLLATGLVIGRASGGTTCVDDGFEDDDTVATANELDASAPISAANCGSDGDVFRIFIPGSNDQQGYTVTVNPSAGHDVALDWLGTGDNTFTFDTSGTGGAEQHQSGFADDLLMYYRVRTADPFAPTEGAYEISVTGLPAPLKITSPGTPVTDDLDSLDPSFESNALPTGWTLRELGDNSDLRANFQYRPNDGSDPEADVYSYGTGADPDRALGTLGEGSGLHPRLHLMLRNDTGSTIDALEVSYTGEQWRLGATGGTDTLDVAYRRAFQAYSNVDALDFSSPNTAGTAGALNGNAPGNSTVVQATTTGLAIPPGGYFFFRWNDLDIAGLEDGLAVDDLSIGVAPDEDADGVPDSLDACSDTPSGESVDVDGCSDSQKDDDLDGMTNDIDDCPGTPSGEPVDANGCSDSQKDDDFDGVSNADDDCLSSLPGDPVGADGCAWTVDVTKKGKGKVKSDDGTLINCGAVCTHRYPSDSVVTLTAKPKRGWKFAKWDPAGACGGFVKQPCVLNFDGSDPVVAHAIFKKRRR